MGRRRAQASRLGRAGCVRGRAEGRRACDQPHLRTGRLRARRDSRRRYPGRRRHDQPANDLHDSAEHDRRGPAGTPRGSRRGLHVTLGLSSVERAACRDEAEGCAEPSQRRGRVSTPEGLHDHGDAAARRLGVRDWCGRGARPRLALRDARLASCARLPDESLRREGRDDRGSRRVVLSLGNSAPRPRLRDRRCRGEGRLDRAAAASRRPARAATVGARVQMGADDGPDEARQNHDPRRSDRCAESMGRARAGRGRRRHRVAGDAAQRGGHQPQGHP